MYALVLKRREGGGGMIKGMVMRTVKSLGVYRASGIQGSRAETEQLEKYVFWESC